MNARVLWFALFAGAMWGAAAAAQPPPLLARALQQWDMGAGDLAFTQRTRIYLDDGSVKEEHLERFDPSLPDNRRWQLLEVDGNPATDEQRQRWENHKNAKPRKQVGKSLNDYLDLQHATLTADTPEEARFEVGVRPETSRLLAVKNVVVVVTVEKENETIAHIAAMLRGPIRVLLGVVNITDFDLDVGIEPKRQDSNPVQAAGEIKADSMARVMMSKVGYPVEYVWSDFQRVASYTGSKNVQLAEAESRSEPPP